MDFILDTFKLRDRCKTQITSTGSVQAQNLAVVIEPVEM